MNKSVKTIIFDVNETLLELSPLKESINSAFEHENAADIWFAELLQYSLVESITHSYHDFSEIAAAVLKMNAQKWNKDFSDKEIEKILSPITKLPAYPDVKTALNNLKNAGYKLIAFSNGKPSVLIEQLDYAGLSEYFDKILSVDSVKKYKPHSDAYKYAVNIAGVDLKDAMLVAAHGWDITGAMRAGLETVFIQRPGESLFPLAQKPTLETANIETLSKILIGSKS